MARWSCRRSCARTWRGSRCSPRPCRSRCNTRFDGYGAKPLACREPRGLFAAPVSSGNLGETGGRGRCDARCFASTASLDPPLHISSPPPTRGDSGRHKVNGPLLGGSGDPKGRRRGCFPHPAPDAAGRTLVLPHTGVAPATPFLYIIGLYTLF